MKKFLQKVLLTACVFAFFSCSSNDESSNSNQSVAGESEKTATKTYTNSGTFSLKYPDNIITEIEIYALGGGGGGGGSSPCSNYCSGCGGGAAATYVKLGNLRLSTGEEVILDIKIGAGGGGGHPGTTSSECCSKSGGETTVRVVEKNITVVAKGGIGITGGGGTASSLPTQSVFYKDGISVAGKSCSATNGGESGKITRGSLSSFGGGNGGPNPGDGGGGISNGAGGEGLAKVVVKYN